MSLICTACQQLIEDMDYFCKGMRDDDTGLPASTAKPTWYPVLKRLLDMAGTRPDDLPARNDRAGLTKYTDETDGP